MQFFAGIDWNLVKNKSVKAKLDFVLEDEETKATRGKQCQEMEFEEFEGEEEMEGEEMEDVVQVEADCSRTSLWLDGFTQGPLTQQTASLVVK